MEEAGMMLYQAQAAIPGGDFRANLAPRTAQEAKRPG